MHPDLDVLIQLQKLEDAAEAARRRIAEEPDRLRELDERIARARDDLAAAKQHLADSQTARRELEKHLAAVQSRLSKFRDQVMEVKTNREYQAMQKEMEGAQREIREFEDKLLEQMLAADEAQATVKRTEATCRVEEVEIAGLREALTQEIGHLREELDRTGRERDQLAPRLAPQVLAMFETVLRMRRGIAVAEAREETCTICHVRLRPQMFNEIRRNDTIIQCGSCGRILYFVPPAAANP
jgi:uncharacterized protein